MVLAVRLVYLASLERSVLGRWPEWAETDEHATLAWSARLAAGNWLDVPPFRPYVVWQRQFGTREEWDSWYPKGAFYQGALYPYLVALVRKAALPPVAAVRLLQALLAASAAAALAAAVRNIVLRSGRKIGAAISAGTAAGLFAGLYGPAVFHDGFVQRDGPLLSVSVLLVAAPFLRSLGSPGGLFVTGLAAGAAILLKQTMAPLALVALWAAVRQEARPLALRRVAAAGLGLALPLLLLVGRNVAAGASPFSYDTRQGIGFAGYLSRGSTPTVVPSPLTGEILSKAGGSTWKAAKLAFESHVRPSDLALLVGRKVATFFQTFEVPDNANFYLFQGRLAVLRVLPVFPCILGLGLMGLALGATGASGSSGPRLLHPAETAVVAAALLVPFVSSVLPSITSRYRLGVAAPLALGCGLLAAYLASEETSGKGKAAAVAAAIGISFLTLLPPVIPASRIRGVDEEVVAKLEATAPRPSP